MAQAFDPYHKWLGIPPEEQPPNHYRLLGIPLFESDHDVIESAADRQMAHVQTHKTGKHSALSQKLLNELAAARLCLLNPAQRANYDAKLRASLPREPATNSTSLPVARALPVVADSAAAQTLAPAATPLPVVQPAVVGPHRQIAIKSRTPLWQQPVVLATVTAAILLLAGVIFWAQSGLTSAARQANDRGHGKQPPARAPERVGPGISSPKPGADTIVAGTTIVQPKSARPASGSPSWLEGVTLALSMDEARIYERDGRRMLRDLSGSDHDGEIHGAPLAPGKVNEALHFETAEDHVDCGDAASFNSSTISIAVWVNAGPWGRRGFFENVIVSKQDWARRGAPRGFELRLGGARRERASFTLIGGDGKESEAGIDGVSNQAWHFLVGTFDGQTQRLYVDGQERITALAVGPIETSPFALMVGRGAYAKNRHFVGAIDELALWNRVLTSTEIRDLYQQSELGKSYCEAIAAARGVSMPSVSPSSTPVQPSPPPATAARSDGSPVTLADLLATSQSSNDQIPNRRTVPTGEPLQAAEQKIDESYKAEVSRADEPLDKLAVSKKMLEQARVSQNEPAVMFVLMRRAAELAATSGRYDQASAAIDELGRNFIIDTLPLQESALASAARLAKSQPEFRKLAESWRLLSEQAVAKNRFHDAVKYSQQALAAVRKTSDKPLTNSLVDADKDIAAMKAAYDQVAGAHASLKEDLQDQKLSNSQAAADWGRFCCLYKNDWDGGLRFWRLDDTDSLAALAERDAQQPASPQDQIRLAGAWWDAAEEHPEELPKKWLRSRAAYWYRRALPALTGFEAIQAKERIETVQQQSSAFRLGEWVDVLSLVETDRHRMEGNVARRGREVLAGAKNESAIFYVPVTTTGSYEFEVFYTVAAGSEFKVFFPIGETSCCLILAGWNGKTSGLHLVDGRFANDNPTTVKHGPVVPGKRNKLLIQVSVAEDQAEVAVDLDSKKFIRWQGAQSSLRLGPNQHLPQTGAFAMGTFRSAVVVHSGRLRITAGTAKSLNN